jgi:hypothetical protein
MRNRYTLHQGSLRNQAAHRLNNGGRQTAFDLQCAIAVTLNVNIVYFHNHAL